MKFLENKLHEQQIRRYESPYRLLLITISAGFITEAMVMFFLYLLPPLPEYLQLLLDLVLTILVVFPIFAFGLLRPLALHLRERRRAEAALEEALSEMELRVQERTEMLAEANHMLVEEISERKKVEERLQLQSAALEAAANGIVITDRSGQIQWSNPAFLRMTGYSAGETRDKNLKFLKSGYHNADFYRRLWEMILSGQVWQGEMINRRRDGSLYIEEQTVTPVISQRGEVKNFIAIKQDITKRKRNEIEIMRRNQELARLNQIGARLTNLLEPSSIIEVLIAYLVETLKIPAGLVYLIQETQDQLQIKSGWGVVDIRFDRPITTSLSAFHCQQVVQEQVVVRAAEVPTIPSLQERGIDLSRLGLVSYLCIPLLAQGRIQGILELFGCSPNYFKPAEVPFYRALGNQIGIAIQNSRLYEAEKRARWAAETLRHASLSLSQSLDLDTVLNTLLDYISSLFVFDTAQVTLLEANSHFVLRAARGEYRPFPCQLIPLDLEDQDNPLLQDLLEKRESILIQDTHDYLDIVECPAEVCTRSWIIVPLKAGDHVLGTAALGKAEPSYFTQEHLHLAEALVSQATVALQNAWLFDQVRTGHRRLQSLSQRLVNLQETERSYIARELHDETGQALASLMISLNLLERSASNPRAVINGVAELETIVSSVMENLHRVAMNLHPASLDHLGLAAALQQYVDRISNKYQLTVQCETIGIKERLPVEVEIALYRIVQEALTNVVRHAQANRVDILLEKRGEHLVLFVEDNGRGFDLKAKTDNGCLGLFGIQERVEMLGGKLIVESAEGRGTALRVEVPYRRETIPSTQVELFDDESEYPNLTGR